MGDLLYCHNEHPYDVVGTWVVTLAIAALWEVPKKYLLQSMKKCCNLLLILLHLFT